MKAGTLLVLVSFGAFGALADGTNVVSRFFPRTGSPGQDGSADHPFEIADEDDLRALASAVSESDEARDLCYILTEDVALTAPWPGIGIPNGKDIWRTEEFDDGAFRGMFDGQNHTVSGFRMQGGGLD